MMARARRATSSRALLWSGLVLAAACGASGASVGDSHPITAADLDRLRFGQTTPAEVQDTFGAPDERAADGSLVYRERRVGSPGRSRRETVTFRFQDGVLRKVCRTRS
jgi:hypothetical protein